VACPRCGTKNENSPGCKNCGAKLPAIDMDYINEMMQTGNKTVQSDGKIRYETTTVVKSKFDPGIYDGTSHIIVVCPKCGKKNKDSKICKKCGEKLPDPAVLMEMTKEAHREAEFLPAIPHTKVQHVILGAKNKAIAKRAPQPIDTIKIVEMMESAGFKNVQLSSEFKGSQFQITAEGRVGIQKLMILVKVIDILNEQNATAMAKEYSEIRKHSLFAFTAPAFLYVVIAGDVDGDSKRDFALRIAGGISKMDYIGKYNNSLLMIADTVSRDVYPKNSHCRDAAKIKEIILQQFN